MHKKLEAELVSLAHSILQMKNKDEVLALKEKARLIYEKLSVLVFVPIRYLYPSRTPWMMRPTLILASLFGLVLGVVCFSPDAAWAQTVTQISLLYPVYYVVVSLMHHRRVMQSEDA